MPSQGFVVLRTVAATMAAEETRLVANVIAAALPASRNGHGHSSVLQNTRRGTVERVTNMAHGKCTGWSRELAGQLSCAESLRDMGFKRPGAAPDNVSLEQETVLAHYAWEVHIRLLGIHLETMLSYSHAFPFMVVWAAAQRQSLGCCVLATFV